MLVRYMNNYIPKLGDFNDTLVIDIDSNKKWLFDPCGTFVEMNDAGTKQFVQTVDELDPATAEENVLYLLRAEPEYLFYVFVDGNFRLIGGTGYVPSKQDILKALGMSEQVITVNDEEGKTVAKTVLARV